MPLSDALPMLPPQCSAAFSTPFLFPSSPSGGPPATWSLTPSGYKVEAPRMCPSLAILVPVVRAAAPPCVGGNVLQQHQRCCQNIEVARASVELSVVLIIPG